MLNAKHSSPKMLFVAMNTRWQPRQMFFVFFYYALLRSLGLMCYIKYIKIEKNITKVKNVEVFLAPLFRRVCRSLKYLSILFFCLVCERDLLCFLLWLETHSPHEDLWHAP